MKMYCVNLFKKEKLQEEIAALNIPNAPCKELSMGMSNDYKIAVELGDKG